jgi:D-sedoheptulose 7-phosphate isomerase
MEMKSGRIAEHFASHQRVIDESVAQLAEPAEEVARILVRALGAGRKVIAFGNGGSAAQASHLRRRTPGRFSATRQPFPAIALASDAGTVTCIANDFGYDVLFERQVRALAEPGDVAFRLHDERALRERQARA